MANEITAEMLARQVAEMIAGEELHPQCDAVQNWVDDAYVFTVLARAYAALQAQPTEAKDECGHPWCGAKCGESPTEAPRRVRCWMTQDGAITRDPETAKFWIRNRFTVTPGHFVLEAMNDRTAHD